MKASNNDATLEKRRTALGTFNFAESFRLSADRLRISTLKRIPFDAPVRFLYYHSIELYLKSYLRSHGISAAYIKSKYQHRFRKLEKACAKYGLKLDDEDHDVIERIDGDNYWMLAISQPVQSTLATFARSRARAILLLNSDMNGCA